MNLKFRKIFLLIQILIGHVFSHFCQISRGRQLFCNKSQLFQRIIPFTSFNDSNIRRSGAIGLIKNLCFDITLHKWLLNDVDILPCILLPLAGPEEYDDEDNEKFPTELQVVMNNIIMIIIKHTISIQFSTEFFKLFSISDPKKHEKVTQI